MAKIEVISVVGRKEKPTYHPKHGGLFRGRMVLVEEAEAKTSKLFISKEDYQKYLDAANGKGKQVTRTAPVPSVPRPTTTTKKSNKVVNSDV